MRGPALFAATLLAAITVTACATMNVGSYRATSFAPVQYQTWNWAAADTPAGDPRFGTGIFRDRLEGAMEKQLAARGLLHVFDRTPDLWIHYHTNVVQRFETSTFERDRASCSEGECGERIIPYEEGTIVFDVIDARTNALVWRGWAQDSITGVLENPDRMADYVKTAARKIMERFPAM
jgi:hypothetical protein